MSRLLLVSAVAVVVGCSAQQSSVSDGEATSSEVGLSFEQFVAEYAFKEPDRDVYIADGDTALKGLKQLREFYELNVRRGQLIINRIGSADDKWDATRKKNLTYCVSDAFGSRKATVVAALRLATQSWMDAADLKFVYVPEQDARCTASNREVLFDVNPVNARGAYLARSFFPADARWARNLLIDNSLFAESAGAFVGVLRHELGHVLGFRHEHTRPEARACFEDRQYRALTTYDSASVMHYPHCRGTNTWNLPLTALDKQGAQAVYGAPQAPAAPAPVGPTTVETVTATLPANGVRSVGPFAAKPGTVFTATLAGTGDADLFVRLGAAPTAGSFDCRPFTSTSDEECAVSVTAVASQVYVSIVAGTDSQVTLRVEYEKATATPPAPAPSAATEQTGSFSGTVTKDQQVALAPIAVAPGSSFSVTMTGAGDADLYVRFGQAPTLTAFDCRPLQTGAQETCAVTVPAGQTSAHVMVNGYAPSTAFQLAVRWTGPAR